MQERIIPAVIIKVVGLIDVFKGLVVYLPFATEELLHFIYKPVVTVERKEWMVELYVVFVEKICHVLVDDFRISSYYRAVVVVSCCGVFNYFILNAWIENPLDSLVHQPLDVSVN